MYLYAVLLHMSNCIHFVADLAHILNYFLHTPSQKEEKIKRNASYTVCQALAFQPIAPKRLFCIINRLEALPKVTFKKKIQMVLFNIFQNEDS